MSRLSVLRILYVLSLTLSISAVYACEYCGSPSITHDGGGSEPPPIASAAPALSSRPGAAYTLYLDFDGFTFNGNWGATGKAPGTTAAYSNTNQIAEIWARTAEKYSAFNINVTTVDPAVTAGQATTHAQRQAYYDATPRVMHSVIGGNGAWYGSAGGVSYVGVMPNAYTSGGWKTNWTFTSNLSNNPKYIAEAASHEDGHALGLSHQTDTNAGYSSNGGASGNNSYAPIMGVAYGSQKGTWSVGTINQSTTQIQNDVQRILQNSGMSLIDSGIGHSFATATALPLTGTTVNASLAQGVITPLLGQTPNPIGIDNYTKDYFKFTMGSDGNITLTLSNGGDWITPGTVSAGFTLRSKLNIFRASDLANAFGLGIENAAASASTFSGFLPAGDYYAQITSYGGYQTTYDTQRRFYDMGSYILSGSGIRPIVVPETGTIFLLGLGLVGVIVKQRRKK